MPAGYGHRMPDPHQSRTPSENTLSRSVSIPCRTSVNPAVLPWRKPPSHAADESVCPPPVSTHSADSTDPAADPRHSCHSSRECCSGWSIQSRVYRYPLPWQACPSSYQSCASHHQSPAADVNVYQSSLPPLIVIIAISGRLLNLGSSSFWEERPDVTKILSRSF